VSFSGSSILSVKMRHASPSRAALKCLKTVVDQLTDLGASARSVVPDRLA
jgi:hypothetical protein